MNRNIVCVTSRGILSFSLPHEHQNASYHVHVAVHLEFWMRRLSHVVKMVQGDMWDCVLQHPDPGCQY